MCHLKIWSKSKKSDESAVFLAVESLFLQELRQISLHLEKIGTSSSLSHTDRTEQRSFPPVSIPDLDVIIPAQSAFIQVHSGEVENNLEEQMKDPLVTLDVSISDRAVKEDSINLSPRSNFYCVFV